MKPDVVVDATGHTCPMPVILAAKAMRNLSPGQVILVKATDSGAKADIPSWVEMTGNELLASDHDQDTLIFSIRKA